MKLRDALLDALVVLPGARRFHLHVLVSAPRKYADLYPYATSRPRIYAQDILVLCSEQSVEAAPRILVSAIEAALYNIPSSASAILYVAKVDGTGQGTRPSPIAALVRALLKYYIDPATRPIAADRLWIHLFARAQRQYLFPNSGDHPDKSPLNDIKLCAWWKRVYTQVARELVAEHESKEPPRLYYLLFPAMEEIEALQSLGEFSFANLAGTAVTAHGGLKWIYGHPYSQTEVPLPYVGGRGKEKDTRFNLGQYIPSFEDDPKTRFVDEIACTTQVDGIRSPKRKRARTLASSTEKTTDAESVSGDMGGDSDAKAQKEERKEERIPGELGMVNPEEFWARMAFRQECASGATTGYFVAIYPWTSKAMPDTDASRTNPLAPQPGQVSFHLVRRVAETLLTKHEFSSTESTLRATEGIERSIKHLCEGFLVPNSTSSASASTSAPASGVAASLPLSSLAVSEEGRKTPEPQQFLAPPHTPRRVPGYQSPPSVVDEVSPNPFPEPVASLDTYTQYIYGTIAIANAEAPARESGSAAAASSASGAVSGGGVGDAGPGTGGNANQNTSTNAMPPGVNVLAPRKKKR